MSACAQYTFEDVKVLLTFNIKSDYHGMNGQQNEVKLIRTQNFYSLSIFFRNSFSFFFALCVRMDFEQTWLAWFLFDFFAVSEFSFFATAAAAAIDHTACCALMLMHRNCNIHSLFALHVICHNFSLVPDLYVIFFAVVVATAAADVATIIFRIHQWVKELN